MNIRKYIFTLTSFAILSNVNMLLAMEECSKKLSEDDRNTVSNDFGFFNENNSSLEELKTELNELPMLRKYNNEKTIKERNDIMKNIKSILDNEPDKEEACSLIGDTLICNFSLTGVFDKLLFDILPYEHKKKFVVNLYYGDNPCVPHYKVINLIHCILEYSNISNKDLYEYICSFIEQIIVNQFRIDEKVDGPLFGMLPRSKKDEVITVIKEIITKGNFSSKIIEFKKGSGKKDAITTIESLTKSGYLDSKACIQGVLRELRKVPDNKLLNSKQVGWVNATLEHVRDLCRRNNVKLLKEYANKKDLLESYSFK